jgi:type II secretory pathway pseudopilin PulG
MLAHGLLPGWFETRDREPGRGRTKERPMTDTTLLLVVVALAAVALVIAASVFSARRNRARSAELQSRFGPEYDRAVQEYGGRARAERVLAKRERRVEKIAVRELDDADRAHFTAEWGRIQEQFVDDPRAAVAGVSALIKEVMQARGYPADGFEQRAADLSVDHPEVVQHYRAARALAESSRHQGMNTEELRQAVVHYRALFADLLQPPSSAPSSLREAHA